MRETAKGSRREEGLELHEPAQYLSNAQEAGMQEVLRDIELLNWNVSPPSSERDLEEEGVIVARQVGC